MTYRAALIGCGRIGADINPPGVGSSRLGSHAGAYAASRRVDLVAACDPEEARREEAKRRWNIAAVYPTVEAMLAADTFDIVSVTTPAAGRAALVGQIVDSGRARAILAEKPLADTVEEAEALSARAAGAGVIGAVNYIRRFAPGYRAVAADLQSGALGEIQMVRGIYTKGVLNNGGHMLDLLRFFFGDPEGVTGLDAVDEVPGDPTASFGVWFPQGFEAWVTGLAATSYSIFELDIVGTRGRIVFGDLGHRVDRWEVEDTMRHHGFRQLSPAPRTSDPKLTHAIAGAVDNLADCLDGRAVPFCSFDDGRAALALALAVREMAQQTDRGYLA